jgi:hypothetical protein
MGKELKLDLDKTDIDTLIQYYKEGVKKDIFKPLTLEVNGKKIDAFVTWNKARKYGALETAAVMAETPLKINQALDIAEGRKIKNALGKYENIMRKWTESTNNFTRFAGYIDQVSKGKSWTGAAEQVKKYYFDYFDLTPFERKYMKRIVPFYTWTRKNIPMEVQALIERPKSFARVQKAMDAVQGEDHDIENMPDWAKDVGLVGLGNTGKYINPNLPYQDLGRLPVNIDNIINLLASVNPLIRAPIEYGMNTEMYSGAPIERYRGETRNAPFIGSLMKALGAEDTEVPQVKERGLGFLLKQMPLINNLDTVLDPDNPRAGARLSSMLGLPSYFEEDKLKRSEIYEENRRLLDLLRLLRDQGYEIPTTDELNQDPRKDLLRRLGIEIPD